MTNQIETYVPFAGENPPAEEPHTEEQNSKVRGITEPLGVFVVEHAVD